MTEQDLIEQLRAAVVGPIRELFDKVLTVLEQQNARLEVLELERAFLRKDSTTPADASDPGLL